MTVCSQQVYDSTHLRVFSSSDTDSVTWGLGFGSMGKSPGRGSAFMSVLFWPLPEQLLGPYMLLLLNKDAHSSWARRCKNKQRGAKEEEKEAVIRLIGWTNVVQIKLINHTGTYASKYPAWKLLTFKINNNNVNLLNTNSCLVLKWMSCQSKKHRLD